MYRKKKRIHKEQINSNIGGLSYHFELDKDGKDDPNGQ
jgi:hypothetical protein